MSVSTLIPANSQRSRATALDSFEAFLLAEGISLGDVCSRISADDSGKTMYITLDKYGWFLVTSDGRQGKSLSRNSVLSYFGNVKNWLVERFPQQGQLLLKRLQKMLSTIDSYCAKRSTEGVSKEAPPCTKRDLRIIIDCIYNHASNPTDYLDAALVNLMWYFYGRGSDAEQLESSNYVSTLVSVHATAIYLDLNFQFRSYLSYL